MAMALLKSVDNVPNIDYYEYRDIDFYSKFKYRARVTFEGAWHASHTDDFFTFIKNMRKFKSKYRTGGPASIPKLVKKRKAIEEFFRYRNQVVKDKNFTIRTENNVTAFFSNDLDKLVELKKIDLEVDITEAITGQYSGVKYFVREPKHKYRIYLRGCMVDKNFVTELHETLNRTPNLYPSYALRCWIHHQLNRNSAYRWSSGSHSIDYDDESNLSYLALLFGDKLGKKYKLEKRLDID